MCRLRLNERNLEDRETCPTSLVEQETTGVGSVRTMGTLVGMVEEVADSTRMLWR